MKQKTTDDNRAPQTGPHVLATTGSKGRRLRPVRGRDDAPGLAAAIPDVASSRRRSPRRGSSRRGRVGAVTGRQSTRALASDSAANGYRGLRAGPLRSGHPVMNGHLGEICEAASDALEQLLDPSHHQPRLGGDVIPVKHLSVLPEGQLAADPQPSVKGDRVAGSVAFQQRPVDSREPLPHGAAHRGGRSDPHTISRERGSSTSATAGGASRSACCRKRACETAGHGCRSGPDPTCDSR